MEENKVLIRRQKDDINDGSFELESDGLGSFRFPICDDIPSGYYVSYIVDAKKTVTSSGKDTILVYYEIEPYYQCKAKANGKLSKYHKEEYYQIIQSYPYGSTYIRDFKDAMSIALTGNTGEKFTSAQIKGIEEVIKLEYKNTKKFGGFSNRRPFYPDELLEPHNDEVEEIEYDEVTEEYDEEAGYECDW